MNFRNGSISLRFFAGILLYLLQASFSGTTAFGQERDTSAFWDLSIEELQTITISTSTKTEQAIDDAPSIITVVTENEITNSGATTLREVLQQVVGIDMIAKEFQPLTYIGIRGLFSTGSNNKIKTMINGHTLSSAVGDPFFHINSIPLENIKQIEIIQGPGSALYGTNAFLGVINIITKDQAAPFRASIQGGSYSSVKPSLEASYSKNDAQFYIYGDYSFTKGPSLLVESDAATVLFGEKYSAAPGYTTEGNEYVTLQSTFSKGGFFFNGFFQGLKTECAVGVNLALTNGDDIRSYIGFGELGYTFHVGETGNITLKGYYDHHLYEGLYEMYASETTVKFSEMYPETPYPAGEGVYGLVKSNLSVLGAELSGTFDIGRWLNILAGTSVEFNDQYGVKFYTSGNLSGRPLTFDGVTYGPLQYYGFMRDVSDSANWNQDASRTIGAVYIQGLVDFKKLFSLSKGCHSLVLTLGGRYDIYSDIGSSFSPRIGLVYAPVEKLFFKLLYGKAFRAPFFHELFQAGSSVTWGNANLQPENIQTFEVQAGYHFTKKLVGKLTYFHTWVTDLILRDATSQYNNFGKFRSTGLEMEMKYIYAKNKYAFLNLTYQDVKNTTHQVISSPSGISYEQPSFLPGGAPSFIGNIGVNYRFFRILNANIAVNYVSRRNRSEEKAFGQDDILVLKDTRDPIPGRALLTASLMVTDISPKLKGLQVQVTGFNLLNTGFKDPEPKGRVFADIPQAGIHFMVRVSYRFN